MLKYVKGITISTLVLGYGNEEARGDIRYYKERGYTTGQICEFKANISGAQTSFVIPAPEQRLILLFAPISGQ